MIYRNYSPSPAPIDNDLKSFATFFFASFLSLASFSYLISYFSPTFSMILFAIFCNVCFPNQILTAGDCLVVLLGSWFHLRFWTLEKCSNLLKSDFISFFVSR